MPLGLLGAASREFRAVIATLAGAVGSFLQKRGEEIDARTAHGGGKA